MRGKISDFGLSVIREKTKNESRRINNPQSMAISYVNHVGGTRIYMAPELQQSSRFTKEW